MLTAEGVHSSIGFFMHSDGVHGVLVGGLELGVRRGLTLEIHLSEHVQGRFLTGTAGISSLLLQRTSQLPSVLIAAEAEGLTVLCLG